jgi:hypothetical protein
VQVKQIKCSNCGAPIDLERSTACSYCGSPVSILDPDAVKNAMQMWIDADAHEHKPARPPLPSLFDPSSPLNVRGATGLSVWDLGTEIAAGSDLVHLCIGALRELF